jgi:hypothetical protein
VVIELVVELSISALTSVALGVVVLGTVAESTYAVISVENGVVTLGVDELSK